MAEQEKVIKTLEACGSDICDNCPYYGKDGWCEHDGGMLEGGNGFVEVPRDMLADALALLKAQEPATIEPKRIELADETKAWLDKMDAVDALGNIADICIDWDGYRTADGLGGLINEIWAYARYCAAKFAKAQEPRVLTLEEVEALPYGHVLIETNKFGSLRWLDALLFCKNANFSFDFITLEGWALLLGTEYKREWRCWSSRPTDAQSKAVKWE